MGLRDSLGWALRGAPDVRRGNLFLGPAQIPAGASVSLLVVPHSLFRPTSWKLIGRGAVDPSFFRLRSIRIGDREQLSDQLFKAGGPSFGVFDIGIEAIYVHTVQPGETLTFVIQNESSCIAQVEVLIEGHEIG